MKQLLITIAALVLVGCGPSEADHALLKSTQEGNIKAVKEHLAAGTDVNAKNRDGVTPLHTAAANDYKEIVELLIAKGADVNAKGYDGNTPLDLAIEDDVAEIEIADLLRKHGGKTGEELKAEGK